MQTARKGKRGKKSKGKANGSATSKGESREKGSKQCTAQQGGRHSIEAALRASRPVLLREAIVANEEGGGTALEQKWSDDDVVAIPAGASVLRYREEDSAPEFSRGRGGSIRFELCAVGRSWKLLLFDEGDTQAHVNGVRAAPITPLGCGDVLRFGSQAPLHLSELRSTVVGPPPAELVGRPCALCSVPLSARTTVHVCRCGAARHLESEENASGDEPLECLHVGDCPECNRSVPSGGLAYRPQP